MGPNTSQQIKVYRQHQPIWRSPCELGDPCGICRAHLLRKKLRTRCPLAQETEPAFTVPVKTAIALMKDGMATPLDDHRCQLTFSKIAHLRDRSLKIDEAFLIAYASDQRWARIAFDEGWSGKALLSVMDRPDDGRILSFAAGQ